MIRGGVVYYVGEGVFTAGYTVPTGGGFCLPVACVITEIGMGSISKRLKMLMIGSALLLFSFAGAVQAQTYTLDLYVTATFYQSDGVTPLADGSVVIIMASIDQVDDGMIETSPGSGTYIASSSQGDDVFLGYAYIGQPSGVGPGQFEILIAGVPVAYTNIYIRFFDYTNGVPVAGTNIEWGVTDVFPVGPLNFGVRELEIDEDQVINQTNDFVVIPEPSTAPLFLLFIGLMFGLKASLTKGKKPSPD